MSDTKTPVAETPPEKPSEASPETPPETPPTPSEAPKAEAKAPKAKASDVFANLVASIEATEETDETLLKASGEITEGLDDESRAQRRTGDGLAIARDYFSAQYPDSKTDGTRHFLAWAKARHGLEKAMIYRYMQAAEFWADTAETVTEGLRVGVRTAAFLSTLEEDHREKVLADVSKVPTLSEVEKAADLHVPSRRKAAEKKATEKAKAEATTAEAEEAANRAKVTAETEAFGPKLGAILALHTKGLEGETRETVEGLLLQFGASIAQWAGNVGPLAHVIYNDVAKANRTEAKKAKADS